MDRNNITEQNIAAELVRMNAFLWSDGPPGTNANNNHRPPNRFSPPQWTIFTNRGVLPDHFQDLFRRQLTEAFDALARLVAIYESNGQVLLRPAENRKLDELLASLRAYLHWLEGDFELFLLMGLLPTTFHGGDIWPHRPEYFQLTWNQLQRYPDDHPTPREISDQLEHHERIRWLKAQLVELVRGLFGGLREPAHQQVLRQEALRSMAAVPDSGSGSGRGSGIDTYRRRQLPLTPRRGGGPSVETITFRKEFALLAAGTDFLRAVRGLNSTAFYGIVGLLLANHQPAWIPGRIDYSNAAGR